MDANRVKEIENVLGVKFADKKILEEAFVHRSYLNEHPGYKYSHNERLEFLGDAVLELVVTDHLFRKFKNPEGELTNWRSALVKTDTIYEISMRLGLDKFLFLSKGEQRAEGRSTKIISANAFEAVIGAIYLDQGYEAAKKFIAKNLLVLLPEIIEKKLYVDAKSYLQELTQEREAITPSYKVLDESGPDHDKIFTVGVFVENRELGKGHGHSKQEAQQKAAEEALKNYLKK